MPIASRTQPERDRVAFEPVQIIEIEVARPLADVLGDVEGRPHYSKALALVRLHDRPLGLLDLDLGADGLPAASVAAKVWSRFAVEIGAELYRQGLPSIDRLDASGVAGPDPVPAERASFLAADPPFISVIIPTRDRPQRLQVAVSSILASRYPADRFEVVLVDNAPATAGTADLVRGRFADEPRVRYLRENAPGSASARNHGIGRVEADLLAFTDDDVVVDPHWLTEIARAFASEPDVSCVTGLLLPMELETEAQMLFEQYGGFSRGFERRVFHRDDRPADSPLYPFAAGIYGTGNNMAFRRSALIEIGAFDPALGNGTPALGGVDSEALLRTVLRGHKLVYEPWSIVHHAHRPDYEGLRRQVYNYGAGLTAYLLKTLLDDPALIPAFARKVPAGLRFALNPGSAKNENKNAGYPTELTRLELRGMAYGPFALAKSRRRYGPHRVPMPLG